MIVWSFGFACFVTGLLFGVICFYVVSGTVTLKRKYKALKRASGGVDERKTEWNIDVPL